MTTTSIFIAPDGTVTGAGPFPLGGIPGVITFGPTGPLISTPQIIPLRPVPAQLFNVTLSGQACTIRVYFRDISVPIADPFMLDPPVYEPIRFCALDLYVSNPGAPGTLIIGGVICQDQNRIVRDSYLGFIGDLAFVDTQGLGTDPTIEGLGTRYLLTYWPAL